ncbi:MAG: CCA tRNA nucleotidyltransferase [Halanaeroarchaeum sp.]
MTGGIDVEAVLAAVREEVDPDEDERRRLQEVAASVVSEAEAAVADLGVDADVLQVGSTARGTWVSGDRDIDVFVRFEPSLPRADLERYGLEIGNRVLPDGREEYAEHPYVSGSREGFDVDLVPCYRVDSAREIKSSVDRTPFHNRYLENRLTPDVRGDVRLLKQFLKGIGAYGSDLRTRGFSGFLTELLVIEYGGFGPFLRAAAGWHPPVRLDPEAHRSTTFDDPLVVVDPTDPERNVAAVVAKENVARLQHHARAFLTEPTEARFWPATIDPLDGAAVRDHVQRRDATPLAVRFDAPDIVDDQLYPQLRRSLEGLRTGLENNGFAPFRSAVFADESAVLLVELEIATLPAVERHAGPPVHVAEHARDFLATYENRDVYGPFIEGDRYVVERERSITTARDFVEGRLFDVALGARVETALKSGFEILEDEEIASLVPEFGEELARYFNPAP